TIVGGVVKYKKNGAVFYTSSVTPTYPLVVDTALHGNGSTLSNVVLNAARLEWLVPDHLGTPRIILDQTGSFANVKRHDYLPFGEELFAGTGGRTSAMGYVAGDGVRQQFTSKERDIETGLDYFGARYYASTQGRFTSVDPSRKSIHPLNPQTWNRYSYTYNNPLALVDDNGKWPTSTHSKIIATAFNGLSPEKIRQIQQGSASVDRNLSKPVKLLTENTLLEGQAYKHAMTPGSKVRELGSVEAAKNWANAEMYKFIDAKLGEAQKQFQAGENRNGVNNAALVTFGEAMHPIMDNMSPAHRWMQVYDLKPYNDTYQKYANFGLNEVGAALALNDYRQDMAAHSGEEARPPTPEEMNTMVDQMRMRYLQTFGQEAYEQAVSREERNATERRLRNQRQ
ncbi:MAG TPA: RHS repeat-associated core domain-containing protein, partial [Pyrinomonadaceae bacterium]